MAKGLTNGFTKSLSAPNLAAMAGPVLSRRRALTAGVSLCNHAGIKVLEQMLFDYGASKVCWPVNDQQLSKVLETCLRSRSEMAPPVPEHVMLLTYLFTEAMTFYDLLLRQDTALLRLVYHHYCGVLALVLDRKVCTPDACGNLELLQQAMHCDLCRLEGSNGQASPR